MGKKKKRDGATEEELSTRVPWEKAARRVQSKLMAEILPNTMKDINLLILRH